MRVKFFATYRKLIGLYEIDVPAPATVWELVTGFADKYGEPVASRMLSKNRDDFGPDLIVLINGRNVLHMQGKDTPLCEDDLVVIFPVVAGG